MTYEEEIQEGISKASKKLRGKVKRIVELNSDITVTNNQIEMDKIYDSVSDEEVVSFNSLLIASNGIIRRKDSFFLLYYQLYEAFDNVVRILKSVRDMEDKAALLNGLAKLDTEKAKDVFGKITTNDGVVKVELTPSGTYRVASIRFKTAIREELKKFGKFMNEVKTFCIMLEDYANTYNIADIVPDEILDTIEDIKTGFIIDPELLDYYKRYIGGSSGLMCKVGTELFLEEAGGEKKEELSIFKKFDEAEPIKGMLKLDIFKV